MVERVGIVRKGEILPAVRPAEGRHINGQFAKGNRLQDNPTGGVRKFMTQELISQLHEIDPRTNKMKFGILVEQLIKNATGYEFKKRVYDRKGKVRYIKIEIPSDQKAIEYIFDRLEGRPINSVGFGEGEGGKLTIMFEPIDREL